MTESNQLSNKVLLVEDDRFLHELCKKKFIKENFTVFSAFKGDEVLKIVEKEHPDVIILDILLPELDGMEILQQLKQTKVGANIPVVIVSNYSDRERIQQGMDLGAADYMIKAHFSPDDIVKKVKELIKTI